MCPMNNTNKKAKALIYGSMVLGLLFLILAKIYWSHTAGSLPTYIPGFEAGSTTIHFKHGLGSFIIGLALFAYAWFKSGKKKQVA